MIRPQIYQHAELDGNSFYWPKGETAVLCLHGFTATTVEVRTIASFFCDLGFTTSGPLFPGHGTSPEDSNTKNWKDWVNTAEASFFHLKQNHKTIFILAESMGALTALHLAAKYADIAGLMLFAPALKIPRLWKAKLFWPLKEYIYKKNADDSMLWQGYNVVPLKAAASLYDFQRVVERELYKVKAPAIIFQGKKDTTIDPMSSVIVADGISSTEKELVWLPQSRHVILLDQQLPEVESICLEFIRNNIERIEPV